MKRVVFALLALTALTSTNAAQIAKGELACRNERTLDVFQAASRSGDQSTVDGLLAGAACVHLHRDVQVSVLEATGEWRRVRTTDMRRNITLWIPNASLSSSPSRVEPEAG